MMELDWRYSEPRLKAREQALSVLLARYGSALNDKGLPLVSPETIYGAAHDWVSAGNVRTDGLLAFFKAYYL